MAHRATKVLPALFDLVVLAFIGALWITLSALVNPIGDFPLNDDWVYALAVKSILYSGRFELPSPATTNVFAQAYWGALFCLPFGFSFTALRLSTLTLGLTGIFACYLLLREIGGSPWRALVGTLTLAVNPLYFGLAHTFMTDVPFLALFLAALLCFVRGIRREQPLFVWAAILAGLTATLIRQFALLLLFAFGCAYIVRKGASWRTVAVAIIGLAAGIALNVVFQHWLIETGRTPFVGQAFYGLIPVPFGRFVQLSIRSTTIGLPYLGFFVAPFLIAVMPSEPQAAGRHRRSRVWLFVAGLAGANLAGLYAVHTPIPQLGNILMPFGLGPRTLRDTYLLGSNIPDVPVIIRLFWYALTIVGTLCGAAVLVYLSRSCAQVAKALGRPEWRTAVWLQVLMLVFIGTYGGLLLLVGFATPMFDRYFLLFVPAIFALIVIGETRSVSMTAKRWRTPLSLALVFIYAAVAVTTTHDYLAWNRTRWVAIRSLLDAGISPHKIDGGYEFNGWYLSDPNYREVPEKSYWWVDDDEYIIASGPLPGYDELQRFVFRGWWLLSDASVVVLHRLGSERR